MLLDKDSISGVNNPLNCLDVGVSKIFWRKTSTYLSSYWGGQMALPLNFNTENKQIVNFLLVFLIDANFILESVSR